MSQLIPRVVGLTGNIGAGKSTVAALLRMLEYREVNFGDALRHEVEGAITGMDDMTDVLLMQDQSVAREILALVKICRGQSVHLKPTTSPVRRLLQLWGTEYRRAQNENYWVDKLVTTVSRPGLWVIGDVRFPNEAALVKFLDGITLRVERPNGTLSSPHASEKQAFPVDETIWNTGLVGDLADVVLALVTSWRGTPNPFPGVKA